MKQWFQDSRRDLTPENASVSCIPKRRTETWWYSSVPQSSKALHPLDVMNRSAHLHSGASVKSMPTDGTNRTLIQRCVAGSSHLSLLFSDVGMRLFVLIWWWYLWSFQGIYLIPTHNPSFCSKEWNSNSNHSVTKCPDSPERLVPVVRYYHWCCVWKWQGVWKLDFFKTCSHCILASQLSECIALASISMAPIFVRGNWPSFD